MISNSVIYSTSNASILYIKKREYLYLALEGYISTANFYEIAKALLNGVIYNRVKKILFDTSKVSVIKTDVIQAINDNILPVLEKYGVLRIVLIKSDNVFGNKSIESVANIISGKIEVKVLPTMEQAENWLFNL